jgi:hypothetical protein
MAADRWLAEHLPMIGTRSTIELAQFAGPALGRKGMRLAEPAAALPPNGQILGL